MLITPNTQTLTLTVHGMNRVTRRWTSAGAFNESHCETLDGGPFRLLDSQRQTARPRARRGRWRNQQSPAWSACISDLIS